MIGHAADEIEHAPVAVVERPRGARGVLADQRQHPLMLEGRAAMVVQLVRRADERLEQDAQGGIGADLQLGLALVPEVTFARQLVDTLHVRRLQL